MTIEKKLTITDFKNGIKAPCGLEQAPVVDGKRIYQQTSEYRGLSEVGLKEVAGMSITPREVTNDR